VEERKRFKWQRILRKGLMKQREWRREKESGSRGYKGNDSGNIESGVEKNFQEAEVTEEKTQETEKVEERKGFMEQRK
jgi:hypothetical protein